MAATLFTSSDLTLDCYTLRSSSICSLRWFSLRLLLSELLFEGIFNRKPRFFGTRLLNNLLLLPKTSFFPSLLLYIIVNGLCPVSPLWRISSCPDEFVKGLNNSLTCYSFNSSKMYLIPLLSRWCMILLWLFLWKMRPMLWAGSSNTSGSGKDSRSSCGGTWG